MLIHAKNYLTCHVVTKAIKAGSNHLIEHTVRNVEHCAPTLASGVLITRTIFSRSCIFVRIFLTFGGMELEGFDFFFA